MSSSLFAAHAGKASGRAGKCLPAPRHDLEIENVNTQVGYRSVSAPDSSTSRFENTGTSALIKRPLRKLCVAANCCAFRSVSDVATLFGHRQGQQRRVKASHFHRCFQTVEVCGIHCVAFPAVVNNAIVTLGTGHVSILHRAFHTYRPL